MVLLINDTVLHQNLSPNDNSYIIFNYTKIENFSKEIKYFLKNYQKKYQKYQTIILKY